MMKTKMIKLDVALVDNIKKVLIREIKADESFTFVDMERVLEKEHLEYKGEYNYKSSQAWNVIFWDSLNLETLQAIKELRADGAIYTFPSKKFCYMVDGKVLRLPIAKQAKDYKTPHWLPIVFFKGDCDAIYYTPELKKEIYSRRTEGVMVCDEESEYRKAFENCRYGDKK